MSYIFYYLNGIATFASHSSKRTFAVEEHLKKSIPSFAPTRWSFTSRLVNTVDNYWKSIVDFFEGISESDEDKWNGPDKCTAFGYFDFLKKFQTVFLLNLFSPLFSQSDVIFQILQTINRDIMVCLNFIKDFLQYLNNCRKGFIHCIDCKNKISAKIISEDKRCDRCETVGFQPIWNKTVKLIGLPILEKKRRNNMSQEQTYRKLYYEIIFTIKIFFSPEASIF